MVEQRTVTSEARTRVIEAAYSLFVQRGFADTSMQQIADEASITKATVYHHFRDKQDLYLATLRMAFNRNTATLAEGLQDDPDMRTMIRKVLNVVLEGKRTDMQQLMADFHQHVDAEAQLKFWQEFPKPWLMLEPLIQRAIDRGEIADDNAKAVCEFLYASVAGYVHVTRMTCDGGTPDETSQEQFITLLLGGIMRR